MKVYRIKTSEFVKLTNNRKQLNELQLNNLEKYEQLLGIESKRFLPHGQDIVLIIGQDNKYYITGKNCYQDSIKNILESVDIQESDIIFLNRSSYNTNSELSTEQLKNILLNK